MCSQLTWVTFFLIQKKNLVDGAHTYAIDYSDCENNKRVKPLTIWCVSFKRKGSMDKKEEDKGAEDAETKVVFSDII